MSSVRECHKDLIQNVQIFHYFVLFYIETRRSLIRDYKCDHATLWRLLRWNRKDNFFPRIICECVDCDYYFDYYTSVDNFEDCKSKCKWSCRSEFAIRISLYFDCQQLSDAATFHTTLTRAAPSMATATSPMTAPTPSQHQGTGSVPPRSENIFQKMEMTNIFFRFAKNTGWERTGPTTTLHTLPE